MVKKYILIAACLLVVIGIGGICCLRTTKTTATPEVDLTFRRAHISINTLDPAHGSDTSVNSAMSLVLQPLLDYAYADRPYRLIPGAAAEMPTCSEDGTTYTIRLREAYYVDDPCFSGQRRRVCAKDFVYGWKRLADRTIGGSGEWLVTNIKGMTDFATKTSDLLASLNGYTEKKKAELLKASRQKLYAEPLEGLIARDDETLEIRLNKPNNQFLWFLTMCYMAPVPQEAEEYYGETLAQHPVGSGPYKLRSLHRGYEYIFDRNPEWHGWREVDFTADEVPFETIRYRIVKEPLSQWLMLLTGQLDFLEQMDRNSMDMAIDPNKGLTDEIKARGVQLFKAPTLKIYYLGINMEDPVLGKNKALRQALNAAFDTAQWEIHYRGRVKALNTVAPRHIADALQEPFEFSYNLDKARALLAEAGYPNGCDATTGKPLRITVEVGNASQDTMESMELLASFFAKIGVKLEISVNTWQALLDKVSQRKAQIFMMGWVGDYPDVETFLQLFVSKNQSPGPNRANYINAEVDACYERAIASRDPEEISACWKRIQTIILDECPWILLHYAMDYTLTRTRVKNYIPHNFPYGMEKHYRVRVR